MYGSSKCQQKCSGFQMYKSCLFSYSAGRSMNRAQRNMRQKVCQSEAFSQISLSNNSINLHPAFRSDASVEPCWAKHTPGVRGFSAGEIRGANAWSVWGVSHRVGRMCRSQQPADSLWTPGPAGVTNSFQNKFKITWVKGFWTLLGLLEFMGYKLIQKRFKTNNWTFVL